MYGLDLGEVSSSVHHCPAKVIQIKTSSKKQGSVEKRLASFEEKTKPVMAKYSDKVKTINAERNKDEIFVDILRVIRDSK